MKYWLLWLLVGVVSVIGGVLALFNPLAATLAVEQLAGWVFLLAGVLQVVSVWSDKGFGAKLWAGLVGVMGVLIGVSLLANPLAGMVSLTLVLACLFMTAGLAKVLASLRLRGGGLFWPVLGSGLLSIALALMVWSNLPSSAAQLLGILLAVELISNGLSLIFISLNRKAHAPAA